MGDLRLKRMSWSTHPYNIQVHSRDEMFLSLGPVVLKIKALKCCITCVASSENISKLQYAQLSLLCSCLPSLGGSVNEPAITPLTRSSQLFSGSPSLFVPAFYALVHFLPFSAVIRDVFFLFALVRLVET